MAKFSLMLAADLAKHDFDLSILRYPVLVSPKLDGIRAFVEDGVVLTRNRKPVPNRWVQRLFAPYEGLDGELIVGDPREHGAIGRTQSGVRSVEGTPNVSFWAFDFLRWADVEYERRLEKLAEFLDRSRKLPDGAPVHEVPQFHCSSAEELLRAEEAFLAEGYEGAMVRSRFTTYKFGRCSRTDNDLWKLKRFIDGEALVVALEEAETNNNPAFRDELGRQKRTTHKANKVGNGMVGTIIVEDPTWGRMRLQPGIMPHAERREWWAQYAEQDGMKSIVGRMVHWRAFGYGVKDKPRFPRYYGLVEDR